MEDGYTQLGTVLTDRRPEDGEGDGVTRELWAFAAVLANTWWVSIGTATCDPLRRAVRIGYICGRRVRF
jgi:hypothetical protein